MFLSLFSTTDCVSSIRLVDSSNLTRVKKENFEKISKSFSSSDLLFNVCEGAHVYDARKPNFVEWFDLNPLTQ